MNNEMRKRKVLVNGNEMPNSKEKVASTLHEKKSNQCLIYFVLLGGFVLCGSYISYVTSPIDAQSMDDVVLTQSEGKFALNEDLTHGTRIPLPGPESIVEDSHGNLYSGLVNGTFIKIYPEKEIIGAGKIEMIAHIAFNKGFTTPLFKHGRPLGIRLKDNALYCMDALYGLYVIDLTSKKVERLVQPCDVNPCMRFPDDLDITNDGKYIYFSDASAIFTYNLMIYEGLQGTSSGRVFRYSLETKKLEMVLDKLALANGVQLSLDEKTLVVAESTKYRVSYFDVKTWKKKYVQQFPGMPDNIRRSSKGTFLVAMSSPPARWFEIVVRSPMLRQIFTGSVPYSWIFKVLRRHHNIVVEINDQGEILRTLHDPKGKLTYALSHATQLSDGRIALGSYSAQGFLSFGEIPQK